VRATAAIIAVAVLLAAAPGAIAQDAAPFGPLGPSVGPEQGTPPQPQPQQQPVQTLPPVVEPAEDELTAAEALPLVGMSVLLFVAIGVAIARDARRVTAPRKKTRVRGSSRAKRARVRSAHR
jgi:hypothetical protein